MSVDLGRPGFSERAFVRGAVLAPEVELPIERCLELVDGIPASRGRRPDQAVLRKALARGLVIGIDAWIQRGLRRVRQSQRLARARRGDLERRAARERFVD